MASRCHLVRVSSQTLNTNLSNVAARVYRRLSINPILKSTNGLNLLKRNPHISCQFIAADTAVFFLYSLLYLLFWINANIMNTLPPFFELRAIFSQYSGICISNGCIDRIALHFTVIKSI